MSSSSSSLSLHPVVYYGLHPLTGPSLALVYTLSAWVFLVAVHELHPWYEQGILRRTLCRLALWVAALSFLWTPDPSTATFLGVGSFYWVVSCYALYQTRRCDLVGVPKELPSSVDMTQKVVWITGANSGVGKEAARQLAELGATVILACRSRARAQAAIEDLKRQSSAKSLDLRFVPCDLSSFASVRESVRIFQELKLPLHVLINNAGVMMGTQTQSSDGYELMMQANHLGHFLLTTLLLDTLKQQQEPRVLQITSSTYRLAPRLDLEDPFCTHSRPYTLFGQYAHTKLCNLILAQELARRHPTINTLAIHPGCVRTSVYTNMPWYLKYSHDIFGFLVSLYQKTPPQGAYSMVFAAASSNVPPSGSYLVNGQVQHIQNHAARIQDGTRLWNWSQRMIDQAGGSYQNKPADETEKTVQDNK